MSERPQVIVRNKSGEILLEKRLAPGEVLSMTLPDIVEIESYREGATVTHRAAEDQP